MPIVSRIRKRSLSLRAQVVFIYVVLILGGATMVYPFLIMITGSIKSSIDSTQFDVLPHYLYNDDELFKKYIESRYDEDPMFYNCVTGAGIFSFSGVSRPVRVSAFMCREWEAFTKSSELPLYFYQLGQSSSVGDRFMPLMQRDYAVFVCNKFKGSISAYNEASSSTATAWFYVKIPRERFIEKSYVPEEGGAYKTFLEFKARQDPRNRIWQSAENIYRFGFLALKYGARISAYNKAHGTSYAGYRDIYLPERVPRSGMVRQDWIEFVRENLNTVFVEPDGGAIGIYRDLLFREYGGDISRLNHEYGRTYRSFEQIAFPQDRNTAGARMVDFNLFVRSADPKHLRVTGPDILFRKYLHGKFKTVDNLNRVSGGEYESFAAIGIPATENDWLTMMSHKSDVKWEFISRNYKMVLTYILLHGRGLLTTALFCLFSVMVALTINPMAAYALSRFTLPSTYKWLLFMMATMAFPGAVTMIPNFLLLKQLNLLNTFWALVLPGAASGYSIFLLKGFFDSLPAELYEAASLDGAKEWTMFWIITMALSKPILAVIGLGAFTGAYGAFMYAFTVCQDQRMWTLMVWLFKLQQNSHASVTYAALIIAAIPTLAVFILSQNVIMRGIIVPQEK